MNAPPQGPADPIFPAWKFSGDGPPPRRVEWFERRPLSFAGAWEPLSFRQRAGYAFADEEEFHRAEFSDAALDAYIEAGANALVIPFAKGFGLQATAEELDRERDTIRRAHRKGLKVGTYIRVDCLIPELVAQDCPDVEQWLARGMWGHVGSYSPQQTFRKRVCQLHPGAIGWLERLFVYAAQELNADFLHLDGCSVAATPWATCRCERCVASYRMWLKRELAEPAELRRALGIADLERIAIPEFPPDSPPPAVVASADMQLWFRYLWEREIAFIRHVRRFTRNLREDLAITANPIWSRARNVALWSGCIAEGLFPWLDAVWLEDGLPDAGDHHLRARMGFLKTAREYGIPVCHYHWQREKNRIAASLAVSLAANDGNASCLGFTFRYLPHISLCQDVKGRYVRWADTHRALLMGTRPLGEIALLRHPLSLAWNSGSPHYTLVGFEQLLLRMQVPWRYFDAITPTKLEKIRTLLIPDCECLSDQELATLDAWVRKGGRLLLTANTATHDEYRRRRPRNGLLSKVERNARAPNAEDWYQWILEDFVEIGDEHIAQGTGEPEIYALGEGALGFWPQAQVPIPGNTAQRTLRSEDRTLPKNADALEAFLRRLHGPFRLEVHGPENLLVECNIQPATDETLLHLIHTNAEDHLCDLDIANAHGWEEFRVITPDPTPPSVQAKGRTLTVTGLDRYAVIVWRNLEL